MASFLFATPYSLAGVYAGVLSGKVNRKKMLALACIFWPLATFGSGAFSSFALFCTMRFLIGFFESACNPASYSLISDYFPQEYRSTANAIETSGSYVGGGLSALSVLIIKKWGWKAMYKLTGGFGILMGIIAYFGIKEPKRGVFDT